MIIIHLHCSKSPLTLGDRFPASGYKKFATPVGCETTMGEPVTGANKILDDNNI